MKIAVWLLSVLMFFALVFGAAGLLGSYAARHTLPQTIAELVSVKVTIDRLEDDGKSDTLYATEYPEAKFVVPIAASLDNPMWKTGAAVNVMIAVRDQNTLAIASDKPIIVYDIQLADGSKLVDADRQLKYLKAMTDGAAPIFAAVTGIAILYFVGMGSVIYRRRKLGGAPDR
jgi:hypothetical protein